MTGAKKEVVGTGFVVGGRELTLTYDSAGRPSSQLWHSNFHASMGVVTLPDGSLTATVKHSGGKEDGYRISAESGGNGGVCGGLPAKTTSINKVGSELQLKDEVSKTVETFTLSGQRTGTKDAFGNATTATFSDGTTPASIAPAPGYLLKVTDNNGRSVSFTYVLQTGKPVETGGLIQTITNTSGQTITLGYDAAWNLSTLSWPDSKVKTFVYEDPVNPWALTGIIDENNSRFSTWTYAPSGHATSAQHAGGVDKGVVTYPESIAAFGTEKITEEIRGDTLCRFHDHPGGFSSVILTDDGGEPVTITIDTSMGYAQLSGQSQPAGSGCAASNQTSTFDANGNIASQDNFQGVRTCYLYDSNNRESLRVEGLSNTVACSSVTGVEATLPAGARRIATQWHPDWRLPILVNAPSSLTTVVYHGQPDPFNNNTPANCTSAGSLPDGKPIPVVCKQVVQPTMSASGATVLTDPYFDSVTLLLHGDSTSTPASYGNPSFTDSSKYARSAYSNWAWLSTEQKKFGTASMYLNGGALFQYTGVTSGSSDLTIEGWVYPTATTSGMFYMNFTNSTNDGLTKLYVSGGSPVTWYYDGDSTLTSAGHVTPLNQWTHVAVVRKSATCKIYVNGITAASGACPNAIGNADNLRIGQDFTGYLDDIRVSVGVGRYSTDFAPPAAEYASIHSSSVAPSVPSTVTQYTYDAGGRKLTSKDSLSRTTTYAYYTATVFTGVDPTATGHTVGDLQTITDPKGFVTTFNLYDKAGRVLQMTDPKGVVTAISYTPRGWVKTVTVTPPGAPAQLTTYTYDNVGQLTGVANPDGTSVSYTYDAAHRLVGATDARGNSVTYTLDNKGNRTSEQLKDPSGVLQRTMNRSFDALNRVQQIQQQ